jgi:hypothetical protein
VIHALERLHMELGGQILETRQRAQELSEQMRHVEAVIKMLDPTYNLARIAVKRRTANRWSSVAPLYRRALDVLRTAEQPMMAMDVAWKVFEAAYVKDADNGGAKTVALGIQHSLKNHVGKGVERVSEASPAR